MVLIYDVEIDEYNESEMARHGVGPDEVGQILDDEPRFYANKGGHSATRVMVGKTYGGRLLTVPLAPTPVEGTWRPATAYDASTGDRTRYNR